MAVVQASVAIPDPDTFESTISAAKKAGMTIESAFDLLGVATGLIDETSLAAPHRVKGSAVSSCHTITALRNLCRIADRSHGRPSIPRTNLAV